MFCPNCRQEYREGFTKCHDCSVDLVDELPVEEEETGAIKGRAVEVARFINATDAEMFKGYLLLHNINCVIFDGMLSGLDPLRAVAIGGAKVFVSEDDHDKALEIYNTGFNKK